MTRPVIGEEGGSSAERQERAAPAGPGLPSGASAGHPLTRSATGRPGPVAPKEGRVPTKVAFRDLIIFQIKLLLDGLGDLVLAPLSAFAFLIDLVLPLVSRKPPGRLFYGILKMGERWDRWLTLYKPAKEAEVQSEEGLLAAGLVDANTFLGKVEDVVIRKHKQGSDGFEDYDRLE